MLRNCPLVIPPPLRGLRTATVTGHSISNRFALRFSLLFEKALGSDSLLSSSIFHNPGDKAISHAGDSIDFFGRGFALCETLRGLAPRGAHRDSDRRNGLGVSGEDRRASSPFKATQTAPDLWTNSRGDYKIASLGLGRPYWAEEFPEQIAERCVSRAECRLRSKLS